MIARLDGLGLNSGDVLLPPFRDLMNDQEREARAASREPGSFIVVLNQETFRRAVRPARSARKRIGTFTRRPSPDPALPSDQEASPVDPDTIVLSRIEEQSLPADTTSPTRTYATRTLAPKIAVMATVDIKLVPKRVDIDTPGVEKLDDDDGDDERSLLAYYQRHISGKFRLQGKPAYPYRGLIDKDECPVLLASETFSPVGDGPVAGMTVIMTYIEPSLTEETVTPGDLCCQSVAPVRQR